MERSFSKQEKDNVRARQAWGEKNRLENIAEEGLEKLPEGISDIARFFLNEKTGNSETPPPPLTKNERDLLKIKGKNIEFKNIRPYMDFVHRQRRMEKYRVKTLGYYDGLTLKQKNRIDIGGNAKKILQKIEERREEMEKELKELFSSSPEMWYVHHLLTLRGYKKALLNGEMIKTPYVREKMDEVLDCIVEQKPVFLTGHTGGGKTELAKHAARESYIAKKLQQDTEDPDTEDRKAEDPEPYFIISGSEQTQVNDIFGRQALILKEGKNFTGFKPGPLYRAMEEGKVLIIDEVNAIPHEVLISLNDVLSPGAIGKGIITIPHTEEEVHIKPGFNVVFTGNLNTESGSSYAGLKEISPAFFSRVRHIDYDYLPQSIEGHLNEADEKDELFHIFLAKVMDRYGNAELPPHSIRRLWELAKTARDLQDNFAGKREIKNGGVTYQLEKHVPDLRRLVGVLDAWEKDAYTHTLDYHLERVFIDPIPDESESDREFIRKRFKRIGNFFNQGYKRRVNEDDKEFTHKEQMAEYAFGTPPNSKNGGEIRVTTDRVRGNASPELNNKKPLKNKEATSVGKPSLQNLQRIERKMNRGAKLDKQDLKTLYAFALDPENIPDDDEARDLMPKLLGKREKIQKTDLAQVFDTTEDCISYTGEEALSGGIVCHCDDLDLSEFKNLENMKLPENIVGDLHIGNLITLKGITRWPSRINGKLYTSNNLSRGDKVTLESKYPGKVVYCT